VSLDLSLEIVVLVLEVIAAWVGASLHISQSVNRLTICCDHPDVHLVIGQTV
jgi:hypothetical protein